MRFKVVGVKLKTKYIPSFSFALISVMIVSAIYHSDSTLAYSWSHDVLVYVIYALLAIAILFLLPSLKLKKLTTTTILMIVPAIVIFILNTFFSYGDAGTSRLTIVLWIVFCLFPKDLKLKTFIIFKNIWIVICAIGIICYLCHIIGIPLPHEEIPYYTGARLHYISYGVSYLYDSGNSLRLCGICNEPGYLGTFCALILCVERMNLRKKSNWAILIAGLMTFSVAFIMMVVIYILARALVKARREESARKKVLRYVGVLLVLVILFAVLPNIKTGNRYIDRALGRFAITSEGIAGDDRTSKEFDDLYNATPFYEKIIGKGRGYTKAKDVTETSSYKVYILEYGIVGSLLIWGTLFAAILRGNTKNKDIILFVVVFFASIYQRPNVIALPYLVLLAGGIEYIKGYASVRVVGRSENAKKIDSAEKTKRLKEGEDDE